MKHHKPPSEETSEQTTHKTFLYSVLVAITLFLCVPLPWWPGTSGVLFQFIQPLFGLPWPQPFGPGPPDYGLHPDTPHSEGLAPYALEPLPLGSIKPEGWLKDQLELMAHGLAGHEYDFYHFVKYSPWFGGHSEYSALNEGVPYWFNGLVPLAYGLNDTRLQVQVLDALDKILGLQHADGWLGPEKANDRDLWARFPVCLAMMQLVQAVPGLGPRIIPALYKFVTLMHSMLNHGYGFRYFWGEVRYPDMLVTLQWLYEKYPQNKTDLLMETMYLLKDAGFDWPGYWTKDNYIFADLDTVRPPIDDGTFRFKHSHSVNAGQGLSAGAALYRFTKNESLVAANRRGVNWTFKYHGDPAGSIIGDERESGVAPNRGSELCTAVETMYSLSYLQQTLGDNTFGDRCELAAFNALPVSLTSNLWGRQYLAVPNEPFAKTIQGPNPFFNTGGQSLIYSLDANYPCCTVNFPQGLPKFLSASFVRVGPYGIGHALLGPASVSTTTASGTSANITCDTTYPFNHTLKYTVTASDPFELHLRVPSWAHSTSTITRVENNDSYPVSPDPHTGMTHVPLGAGTSTVIYNLNTSIQAKPRSNGTVSIYHGALLYALDVGISSDTMAYTRNPNYTYSPLDAPFSVPHQIHNVEYTNTKPWNMGIDPSTLVFHTKALNATLPNPIFAYHAPPSYITAKGCPIHWGLYRGLPAPLKRLPKGVSARNCSGNVTEVVLRPYGSLKVHMAELPIVDLSSAGGTKL